MRYFLCLFFIFLCTSSFSATTNTFDPTMFYLGKGKEDLMPQMIQAAELVSKQPDCLEVTDGAWGIVGQDILVPGKKGFMFRITCQVSDLPNSRADNFWISPKDLTNPRAIFRQQKYRNEQYRLQCIKKYGSIEKCPKNGKLEN